MKMTIHRALSELKLIDKKIERKIQEFEPVGTQQKDKLVNRLKTVESFNQEAKSGLQSINELIERKRKIKCAITEINTKTIVNIGDDEMTISDAINYKNIVEVKREFIKNMRAKYNRAEVLIVTENTKVENNALRLAEAALQKDNVKINDGDAVAITTPYIDKNQYALVDPLGIVDVIKEMGDKLDLFESEVDAVLSEINSLTSIEI